MIVIYKANESNFTHLGEGPLSDIINPEVVEERNGQFYMEFSYPIDGANYTAIKPDRIVRADASPYLKDQLFKVIRLQKDGRKQIRVYAEHVSGHTADLQLKDGASFFGSASLALDRWKNQIVTPHPFTTYSDIFKEGEGLWEIAEFSNARQALGGVEGSILDVYQGEYLFDNYHISLLAQRGDDNGMLISYGKNLTDMNQEEEIANTYTSIMPYSVYIPENEEEEVVVSLPEHYVDGDYVDRYARRKILKVDFSNKEITTTENLRTEAKRYVEDNKVGLPKVNFRVKFVDLAKTLDYKGLAIPEKIALCDWVTVRFEKLGIDQRAKVIKTTYDPKAKQYVEVEIGETRTSLTDSVTESMDGKFDEIDRELNYVQMAANGKNRIFRGPDEPTEGLKEGDLWYKPVGNGEYELYQYDGEMWVLIVHSGMSAEIEKAIEEAEKKVQDARDYTEEIEREANSILAGLGVQTVGEIHQELAEAVEAEVGAKINRVTETTELYERVIGSTETGVKSNVAQFVMADNIFRTNVSDKIADVSTSVTQLSNSWALRINSGDELVSAINATEKGVYVKGKDITLDGDTIVDGTFTVTNTMLARDISASKITSGTINAAEVNLINLNAQNIVGANANFIQLSFNRIDDRLQINASGIHMLGSGTWRRTYLSATGFDLYNGQGGVGKAGAIGYFKEHASNARADENYIRSTPGSTHYVGMVANYGHHLVMGYNRYSTTAVNGYDKAIQIDSATGLTRFYKPITASGSSLELMINASLSYRGGTSAIGLTRDRNRLYFSSKSTYLEAEDWIEFYAGVGSHVLTLKGNLIHARKNLYMDGNEITGQSDVRLKENVSDVQLNVREEFRRMRPIKFEWKKGHPQNKNKPEGTQVGIEAQYSPFLQTKQNEQESYLSISISKQVTLNSMGIKDIYERLERLEEVIK